MHLTHDCRKKQSTDSTLKRASERAAEVLQSIWNEFGSIKVLDSDLWLYDDYIQFTVNARHSVDPAVVEVEGVAFKECQKKECSFSTLIFEINVEDSETLRE
ncbi:MAG: hypothetical protein EAX81_06780 [Candidatus Thorarchaeota archaeon]|nr:hypothetical protein [Candidatus Thorarchaeota archaeon]